VAVNLHAARRDLEAMLADRFDLDHTTLQVEHQAPPQLLSIEDRENRQPEK
jgi:hypothetical protein